MDYGIHISRVRAASQAQYGLGNLSDWIERNLYLDGKRFNFVDHEFQVDILNDTSPISMAVKVAQIGMSTISYAHALACCSIMDHWGYGYVFPNTGDATKACSTRINPMIAESPEVKRLVNPDLDNTELKQIGSSFLYFRGTKSETAGLSISLDFLTVDEYDRCDFDVAAQYVSRLQHKETKMRRLFSTPTLDNYGIMKESKTAKRFRHMAQCAHCNHRWLPDYFDDIKVPGFSGDLREITKQSIKDYRWQEAAWVCPKCGRNPDFSHTRMEWVCENPQENYAANCWFISPVTAHKILTPSYLINVSTQFNRYSEFINQSLGKPAEEEGEAILESDLEKAYVTGDVAATSPLHVLGADMGLICRVVIGRQHTDGTLLIVHREEIPLAIFEERRRELCQAYRVRISVHDTQPYVDVIQRITEADPNAYGAMFTTSKSTQMFVKQEVVENAEEGKLNLRRININRTAALDSLLNVIKTGRWAIQKQDERIEQAFLEQMLSLKRVQVFDKQGELNFTWQKTDGLDHFHFALLYMYMAANLVGTAGLPGILTAGIPLVSKFGLKW